jgi:TolA-binding protein
MTMSGTGPVTPLLRPAGLLARWAVVSSLLVLSGIAGVGCTTMKWQSPLASNFPDPKIDGVQGPTERRLRRDKITQASASRLADEDGTSLAPIAGTEDYEAAEALFKDGKFAEAETAFKKVAKKYKKSEIREDALFMQAESAFQRQHYADSYDVMAVLLKEYPSSRYLDSTSRRLFEIARIWLNDPKIVQEDEIQQANLEKPGEHLPATTPVEDKKQSALALNLFDEKKPVFDPEGNAIAALRAIWLNDPAGPLADDALMLAASHFARRSKWVEADNYFSLLREQYPNSPHVQKAFLLGSHVKLMSYEGAGYDGRRLDEARQLKETALRLYPEAENRARLERELAAIEEAEVARLWEQILFYQRKKKTNAVGLYCHMLIDRYPNSTFAPKAREVLNELGPQYATGEKFRLAPPPAPKPSLLPPIPGLTPTTPPELKPVEKAEKSRSWWGGEKDKEDSEPEGTKSLGPDDSSEPTDDDSPGKTGVDPRNIQASGETP